MLYLTSSLFLTSLAENICIFTQQVSHFFVINLDKRAADQELFGSCIANSFQNMAERPGDNALQVFIFDFADHRMCFSTSGLAISKDGSIITGQHILY